MSAKQVDQGTERDRGGSEQRLHPLAKEVSGGSQARASACGSSDLVRAVRVDSEHLAQGDGVEEEEAVKRAVKRLYVWEGVFRDYTSGVAFAMARSEGEARILIAAELEKKEGFTNPIDLGEIAGPPTRVSALPSAGFVRGGG